MKGRPLRGGDQIQLTVRGHPDANASMKGRPLRGGDNLGDYKNQIIWGLKPQ
jgi:hypothetical protein